MIHDCFIISCCGLLWFEQDCFYKGSVAVGTFFGGEFGHIFLTHYKPTKTVYKNVVCKVKPMQRCLKPVFYQMTSRWRLHWLQKKKSKMIHFLLDLERQ